MADGGVSVWGIRLIGLTAENGTKLLLSLGAIAAALVAGRVLRAVAGTLLRGRDDVRARFWSRQAIHLALTALVLFFLVSVWFDRPGRVMVAAGLAVAGVTVALQRVILAVAGYVVILTSRVFSVGDRVLIGSVRGDVLAVGYTRTTLMEMGQPPGASSEPPSAWVGGRQYTGRIATVTNDRVFTDPVYNYSREFPFIWEEIRVPVRHGADTDRAERILLAAVALHTVKLSGIGDAAQEELRRRYAVSGPDLEPRVFRRFTADWVELAARFITRDHGIRELKDAITRDVLRDFRGAGIKVASARTEVAAAPPLRIVQGLEPP